MAGSKLCCPLELKKKKKKKNLATSEVSTTEDDSFLMGRIISELISCSNS
jgi:hypothetical protein